MSGNCWILVANGSNQVKSRNWLSPALYKGNPNLFMKRGKSIHGLVGTRGMGAVWRIYR